MKIIAHTYDADTHCVDCAKDRAFDAFDKERDEHGVPMNCADSEGNPVHPVLSTDEQLEPLFCGDRGEEIE